MLRGLRKASSGVLGKAIMGLVVGGLIVAFAIWGIGDIFRGFGRSTVAKVGNTEISVEQFRQAYNDHLQQLGRRLGRPLTAAQARDLGLERQLASQLVAEATIDDIKNNADACSSEAARRAVYSLVSRQCVGRIDHGGRGESAVYALIKGSPGL